MFSVQEADAAVMLLHLRDITRTGREIEDILQATSGHRLPVSPLEAVLGPVLRNPSLEGLQEGKPLEVVWFAGRGMDGLAPVYVLSVTEPGGYVHYLANRDGVRSNTANGILQMQEAGLPPVDLFACTVQEHLVLQAGNRRALELARELYRTRPAPLVPDAGQAVLHVHCRRLAGVYSPAIEGGVERLAENIGTDPKVLRYADVVNARLIAARAVIDLRNLAGQVRTVSLSASWTAADMRLAARLTLEDGSARDILAATAPRAPQLLSIVPDNAESAEWSAWPPEMLSAIQNGLGQILTASLDSASGQDVRNTLEKAAAAIRATEPEEVLSIRLPAADGAQASPAATVCQLRKPAAFAGALDAVVALGAPSGSIRQVLEQRGLVLTVEKKSDAALAGALCITVTLRKRIADNPLQDQTQAILFRRDYGVALLGTRLFLTSGDGQAQTLAVLVRAAGTPGRAQPAFVREALAGLPTPVVAGVVRPGWFIRSSSRLLAGMSEDDDLHDAGSSRREQLAPFLNLRAPGAPWGYVLTTTKTGVLEGTVRMPQASLRELYDLCLRTLPPEEGSSGSEQTPVAPEAIKPKQ